MRDLRFTVATVVLNGEKVIEKTMKSVLNQQYPPFEYILADGISTEAGITRVMAMAGEKYSAYQKNGYRRLYWLESYGWELFKWFYFSVHRK